MLSKREASSSLPFGRTIRALLALQLASGVAGAVELAPGDILVADSGTLVRVDPATGSRVVVTGAGTGSGPALGILAGVATTPGGPLFVANEDGAFVMEVDLTTGDRSVVTSGTVIVNEVLPYANSLSPIIAIAMAPSGVLYIKTYTEVCSGIHPPACIAGNRGLLRIDLATSDGFLLWGSHFNLWVGSGFGSGASTPVLEVESNGRALWTFRGVCSGPFTLPFSSNGGISRIDPATGVGQLVSGGGGDLDEPTGSGFPVDCMSMDEVTAPAGMGLVARDETDLLWVDRTTGDRSLLAPGFSGHAIDTDAAGHVIYLDGDAIFRLDPGTGSTVLVADLTTGPGPLLTGATLLHVVPEPSASASGVAALAAAACFVRRRDRRAGPQPAEPQGGIGHCAPICPNAAPGLPTE